MEATDQDVLRLAKALAVDTTDAGLLGGVSSGERRALLERACSMRGSLEFLIQRLGGANSATTADYPRFNPHRVSPMKLGINGASGTKCCEHVCGYMNPALWSTLPAELLHMVFARLPFPQICQHLRLLSKQWKRSVTGDHPGSALIRACGEANPKMLAMVFNSCVGKGVSPLFSGTFLYDYKVNLWHFFRQGLNMDQARRQRYHVKCARGGLVCYATPFYPTGNYPFSICVCNPLKRHCRELPSHFLSHLLPSMVQLVVNRDTKSYQVVLVIELRNRGRPLEARRNVAMVYSSATGVWSSSCENPLSSCIFGYRMHVDRYHDDGDRLNGLLGLCAFDGARHEFLNLDAFVEHSESSLASREVEGNHAIPGYALVDDRLYVLHKKVLQGVERYQAKDFCILEYQAQTCKPNWVKLRTHECYPLNQLCDWEELYTLRLDACEGSLMVTAYNTEYGGIASGYKHERAWLYDLCTGEWKEIAALEGLLSNPFDCLLCELHWDAVP